MTRGSAKTWISTPPEATVASTTMSQATLWGEVRVYCICRRWRSFNATEDLRDVALCILARRVVRWTEVQDPRETFVSRRWLVLRAKTRKYRKTLFGSLDSGVVLPFAQPLCAHLVGCIEDNDPRGRVRELMCDIDPCRTLPCVEVRAVNAYGKSVSQALACKGFYILPVA